MPRGSIITIAGGPDTCLVSPASALALQVLHRGGAVCWINAGNTSEASQLFPTTYSGLHWVEGKQASHAQLADRLIKEPAFDMVVVDTLDAFYQPGDRQAREVIPHPGFIVQRLVETAGRVEGGDRTIVFLNHLWESPRGGQWMPGRQSLIRVSSQVCHLHGPGKAKLYQRRDKLIHHPLSTLTGIREFEEVPTGVVDQFVDYGRDGLG